MKLQLDTTNKTIKLTESVTFKELIEVLNKILPKGEWKEFTLETIEEITTWSNPVIIKEIQRIPAYPWYTHNTVADTEVTFESVSYSDVELNQSGVFNMDIQ